MYFEQNNQKLSILFFKSTLNNNKNKGFELFYRSILKPVFTLSKIANCHFIAS